MRNAALREVEADWPLRPPAAVQTIDPARRDYAGWRLLRLVATARGVSSDKLLMPSRGEADVALARQLAMYLMHVALGRTYLEVGRFFGRDRTTVSYACSLVEDLRDDPQIEAEIGRLERRLAVVAEASHARS